MHNYYTDQTKSASKSHHYVLSASFIHSLKPRPTTKTPTNSEDVINKLTQRKALHIQSISRIQSWQNTVLGQHRQRLHARQQRQEQEEKQRQDLDAAWAREELERKNELVKTARQAILDQTADVRKLKSDMLMNHVMEERALQLKLKNERRVKEGDREASEKLSASLNIGGLERKEKEIKAEAIEQLEQVKKRLLDRINERNEKIEEGKKVKELDEEWNSQQRNKTIQYRQQQKLLAETLCKQKQERIERKQAEKAQQNMLLQESNVWLERKDKQTERRKTYIDTWHRNYLQVREEIGRRTFAATKKEKDTMEKRLKLAVMEQEKQREIVEKGRKEYKAKEVEQVKQNHQNYLKERGEERKGKKEMERVERNRILKQQSLAEKREEDRKVVVKEREKELQRFHVEQMREKKEREGRRKAEELEFVREREKRGKEFEEFIGEFKEKVSKNY